MNMKVPRKEPIQRYSQKPFRQGIGAEPTISTMEKRFFIQAA